MLGLQLDIRRPGEVGPGRLAGLAQGDGVGPARQLRRRARPRGARSRRSATSPGSTSCSRPTRRTLNAPILTAADLPEHGDADAAATTQPRPRRRATSSAAMATRATRPSRRCRTCSATGEGVGSNSWVGRRARSPRRASRCWPTTRTWASRRRASGSRSGCAARTCPADVPLRRVGLLVRGHARASSSATTRTSPGA